MREEYLKNLIERVVSTAVLVLCFYEAFARGHYVWLAVAGAYIHILIRLRKNFETNDETNRMMKELWEELRREQDKKYR